MTPFRKTLFFRLSLNLLGVLLVLGFVQLLVVARGFQRMDDTGESMVYWNLAGELAPQVEKILNTSETPVDDLIHFAGQVNRFNPKLALYILNPDGTVVLNLSPTGLLHRHRIDIAPVRKYFESVRTEAAPLYGDNPGSDDRQIVFSAAAVKQGEKDLLLYATLGAQDREGLESVLAENSAMAFSAYYVAITLLCASLAGIILLYRLTRRFERLTRLVGRFGAGDYTQRVPVDAEDEVGALAQTVNVMADTIEANFAELERRDNLRRELIANVSHDLRGPVGTIRTYLETMLEKPVLDQGTLRENVETVQRNIHQLGQLLSELFELSKLEAKEAHLQFAPCSLFQIAQDVLVSYQPLAAELSLELVDETDEATPVVAGDVTLLERVMNNLVENALRYTPAGGSVHLRLFERDGRIRFEVRDTGLGIPEQDLPHIFERFYRAQGNQPRKGTSTGLGLAIVQKIVEAHGSTMEVESTRGQGSTFGFWIDPLRTQPATGSNSSESASQSGK